MSNLNELKRLENDMKANPELTKKLNEAVKRIAGECKAQSDGEVMVQAAKELGYDISIAALEQAKAEAEAVDPEELEAAVGGIKHSDKEKCEDANFLCLTNYHTPIEDEYDHSNWCWTGWHCNMATMHTETADQDVYCWSDYMCLFVNK